MTVRNQTSPEWVGSSKLAALLDVSHMTLWRWQRDLDFPAPSVVNGRKLWPRADIDEWMRKRVVARTTRAA